MSLVVCTPDDLDTMQSQVETIFKDVENKNIVYKSLGEDDFPYDNEGLGKVVRLVPITDADTLKVSFMMPSVYEKRAKRIVNYWTHLFGHESEGSIFDLLKKEGLATGLSAGEYVPMESLISVFNISVDLTKKGL